MSKAGWLIFASLTFGICQASLSACGGSDDRPASVVSAGGGSGHGSGGNFGDAGQATGDAGERSDGGADAGAAGEASTAPAPLAIFPQQLQVDVGCGVTPEPVELVIQNGGSLPLTISNAMASAGYVVKGQLPLQIAARTSGVLQVTPPAADATAMLGDMSSGQLTFVSNEPGSPTHEVLLNTTLFGGLLEFTDVDGTPLSEPLPLTHVSSATCPDDATYRVHNTGNLAFTLFGPTFPTHFAGTSTGMGGRNVAPDEYVELKVGGNSTTDGACSANGALTFTVQGSFCGSVPTLGVRWPAGTQSTGCTCTGGAQ
jgi:hypothetical protein